MCRLYDAAYVLEKRHNIKLFRQPKKSKVLNKATLSSLRCVEEGGSELARKQTEDRQNHRGKTTQERQTDRQKDRQID